MGLDLDERQRAMLHEMGVHVWQPAPQASAELAVAVPQVVSQPRPQPVAVSAPPAPPPQTAAVALRPPAAQPPPATEGADLSALASQDWATLAHSAAHCTACGLCAGRKNSTLQVPKLTQADWLIVGDPPDEDEDRAGQAFTEAAGLLLANMLKAVGAQQVAYATAVVKCRPPQGRNPQPAELAQCAHYLQREIALLRPKVIVAMGRFAIQSLLAQGQPELAGQPLGRLRGTAYRFQNVPVVVTYHPKLLLRASADKAKAWADLCLAQDLVEQG